MKPDRATLHSFVEHFNELNTAFGMKYTAYRQTEAEHTKLFGKCRFASYQSFINAKKYHNVDQKEY